MVRKLPFEHHHRHGVQPYRQAFAASAFLTSNRLNIVQPGKELPLFAHPAHRETRGRRREARTGPRHCESRLAIIWHPFRARLPRLALRAGKVSIVDFRIERSPIKRSPGAKNCQSRPEFDGRAGRIADRESEQAR